VEVSRGRAVAHAAHGRNTAVTIDLGSKHGRTLQVYFVERIKVGGHPEKITFARIYRRCG
ncbi:MAG: hypothetical protein M3071_23435, partial [Actinomycetota bacterium]|nr:hypothetical protein [Actinomycetota bacterium]